MEKYVVVPHVEGPTFEPINSFNRQYMIHLEETLDNPSLCYALNLNDRSASSRKNLKARS